MSSVAVSDMETATKQKEDIELTEPTREESGDVDQASHGGLLDTKILEVAVSNSTMLENPIQLRVTRFLYFYYMLVFFMCLVICLIWGFLATGLLSLPLSLSVHSPRIYNLQPNSVYFLAKLVWAFVIFLAYLCHPSGQSFY